MCGLPALKIAHSPEFSGRVCQHSSKASRGEDAEIEQPVVCRDFSSFYFHATLASVLGATLGRSQVIQQREAVQKVLLAPLGMMEPLHHE